MCLLGGNASGKSTTLKTILGIVRPREGRVRFAGEDVTGRPTSYRISRGMAIVPENRRLFAPMTVLENLEMGAYLHGGGRKEDFERVYSLFPLLHERRSQLAGTLSGGEQQMVAMGRALMARPKLLLMDEPSMGLAPILVERSFDDHQGGARGRRRDPRRRAERERVAVDRRPRLRSVDGTRRPRGKGRRLAPKRRAPEGIPWPLRLDEGEGGRVLPGRGCESQSPPASPRCRRAPPRGKDRGLRHGARSDSSGRSRDRLAPIGREQLDWAAPRGRPVQAAKGDAVHAAVGPTRGWCRGSRFKCRFGVRRRTGRCSRRSGRRARRR